MTAGIWFLAAAACMVAGHIGKVMRWQLFICVYEKPESHNLFHALAAGHALNALLPVRTGDAVRILLSGRKLRNGYSLSAATVAADLYADILTVSAMFFIPALAGKGGGKNLHRMAYVYLAVSAVLVFLTLLAVLARPVIKKCISGIAGLFNESIELRILYLSYLVTASVKDMIHNTDKIRLAGFTCMIWCGYTASYAFFASYAALAGFRKPDGSCYTVYDIFAWIFSGPGLHHVPADLFPAWAAYLLVPLLLCALYSFCTGKSRNHESVVYRKTLPQLSKSDRLAFLQTYYEDEERDRLEGYLKINSDVTVIADASAGSNASTIVVMNDEGRLFYRKYAFNEDGKKLQEQAEWILGHQGSIPLPLITRNIHTENYAAYDMPDYSAAAGMFRCIHAMTPDKSWGILEKALNDMRKGVHCRNVRAADKESVSRYISEKAVKNYRLLIRDCESRYIRNLEQYAQIVVNGTVLPALGTYQDIVNEEHLEEVFREDHYADIHGDLTIENIVCLSEKDEIREEDFQDRIIPDSYYFIDPNTGNIHDSPLLDFGKLLQSLHGNYEFLMMVKEVKIKKNNVSFVMAKSQAYADLYRKYQQYLKDNFTDREVTSIYYHEMIHWLRLMPYKIRKDKKLAAVFYAGLLYVLKDLREMGNL